jgi:hypothetical protein
MSRVKVANRLRLLEERLAVAGHENNYRVINNLVAKLK